MSISSEFYSLDFISIPLKFVLSFSIPHQAMVGLISPFLNVPYGLLENFLPIYYGGFISESHFYSTGSFIETINIAWPMVRFPLTMHARSNYPHIWCGSTL